MYSSCQASHRGAPFPSPPCARIRHGRRRAQAAPPTAHTRTALTGRPPSPTSRSVSRARTGAFFCVFVQTLLPQLPLAPSGTTKTECCLNALCVVTLPRCTIAAIWSTPAPACSMLTTLCWLWHKLWLCLQAAMLATGHASFAEELLLEAITDFKRRKIRFSSRADRFSCPSWLP